MKWIKRIALIMCMMPLMAFTCSKKEGANCHQRLDFTNSSAKEVIVVNFDYYASHGPIEERRLTREHYENLKKGEEYSWFDIVPAGETVRIFDMLDSSMCLENYLKMVDGWIFFVLDAQIVKDSDPDELTDGRAVLDRIYYTLEDIGSLGTMLVYE